MAQSICIVGGGASGVGIVWAFAKAKTLGLLKTPPLLTLIHDQPQVGGHSYSVPVTVNGQTYDIDLGVQMIASSAYPAVLSMLALPEFASVALQDVTLNVSCAFPPLNGTTQYWGNFPAYQGTGLWQAGKADCMTFQTLLANNPRPTDTLDQFLQANAGMFQNLPRFKTYFLDPYMSIMNGYGQALLDDVTVIEIAPLFDLGFANLVQPGKGFQRFAKGSGQWIATMLAFAKSVLKDDLTVWLSSSVGGVWPAERPTVQWTANDRSHLQKAFDAVVLTTDMHTTSAILNNGRNPLWNKLYAQYVGTNTGDQNSVWPLIPGYCYLHQDRSLLAPNMPTPPQETLQFTAYWATQQQPFDLTYSFTTYVERNLMGVGDPAFEYYLTMYGFDPTTVPNVPIPKKGIVAPTPMNWIHGMWLPFFMSEQKKAFHMAQSSSVYAPPYPGQLATNIFFAGNNLTMDAEEGALASGLVLADYAFGIPYMNLLMPPPNVPLKTYELALAELMYMYELMFPSQARSPLGALRRLAQRP